MLTNYVTALTVVKVISNKLPTAFDHGQQCSLDEEDSTC